MIRNLFNVLGRAIPDLIGPGKIYLHKGLDTYSYIHVYVTLQVDGMDMNVYGEKLNIPPRRGSYLQLD